MCVCALPACLLACLCRCVLQDPQDIARAVAWLEEDLWPGRRFEAGDAEGTDVGPRGGELAPELSSSIEQAELMARWEAGRAGGEQGVQEEEEEEEEEGEEGEGLAVVSRKAGPRRPGNAQEAAGRAGASQGRVGGLSGV